MWGVLEDDLKSTWTRTTAASGAAAAAATEPPVDALVPSSEGGVETAPGAELSTATGAGRPGATGAAAPGPAAPWDPWAACGAFCADQRFWTHCGVLSEEFSLELCAQAEFRNCCWRTLEVDTPLPQVLEQLRLHYADGRGLRWDQLSPASADLAMTQAFYLLPPAFPERLTNLHPFNVFKQPDFVPPYLEFAKFSWNWDAEIRRMAIYGPGSTFADDMAARLASSGIPLGTIKTALDLGAGDCTLAAALALHGIAVVATDIPQAGALAGMCAEAGILTWQHDICAPLPVPAGSFDLVHNRYALSYVPEALVEHVVQELARLVTPGGYLWLEAPTTRAVAAGVHHLRQVLQWEVVYEHFHTRSVSEHSTIISDKLRSEQVGSLSIQLLGIYRVAKIPNWHLLLPGLVDSPRSFTPDVPCLPLQSFSVRFRHAAPPVPPAPGLSWPAGLPPVAQATVLCLPGGESWCRAATAAGARTMMVVRPEAAAGGAALFEFEVTGDRVPVVDWAFDAVISGSTPWMSRRELSRVARPSAWWLVAGHPPEDPLLWVVESRWEHVVLLRQGAW